MLPDLMYPEDIDMLLNWPVGRAERLARAGRLPHHVLPDGTIRLRWAEVEPLVRFVPATIAGDQTEGV